MSATPAAILACTMTHAEAGEITRLLHAHHHGDRDAFDRLVPMVYTRLRQIARGQLARHGRRPFLETTSLVHEAYLQLVDGTSVDWRDRGHFFAVCALAMRRIIVDYARQQMAKKRGAHAAQVSLQASVIGNLPQPELILAVDQRSIVWPPSTFASPASSSAGRSQACGRGNGAGTRERLVRTVQREWSRARAWLRTELEGLTEAGRRASRGLRQ